MRIGIIGGGVYGSSIAYFLSKFGEDVVLFEKNDLGGISTSKSAGIVRHHYSNRHHIEIMSRGREILEGLEDHVGRSGGFRQNGYLGVVGPEHEETLREIVDIQRDIGLDVELVEPDEMSEYLPGIDTTDISIGSYESQAGFADPYQVATGFAKRAGELGAEIHGNTPVTDIEHDDGTVSAVKTESDRHDVDYVVNAGGPYGHEVADMVGLDVPLTWYEVKIAVLTADRSYGSDRPTLSDMGKAFYTKPEQGGEFLIGGFNDPEMDEPDEQYETVTTEDLNKITEFLEYRLSGYADAKLVNTWSGVITASPDWHQIIGVPDGYDNFYNVIAGSGHGFKEAAGFAESIAQEIAGEKPRYDLSPYRSERFETGDEIQGRYDSAGWFA
jgi:sarcosine oxidase subunit beta